MTDLSKDATLVEAQDWLRDQLMPNGVKTNKNRPECPCCQRKAQLYRRHIHAEAGRGLIRAFTLGAARGFVHVSRDIEGYQNTDFARSAYWGLIEEMPNEDGGNRSGWWKLTPAGARFVKNQEPLRSKYAWIWNDRVLGFDGGPWSVRDALGSKFDYDELMAPAVGTAGGKLW